MTILITGKTGYIANALKSEIPNAKLESVRSLEQMPNFEHVNVFIHTAALVHKKETYESKMQYEKVNTELTIRLAKEAKQAGVKHFILFSTMAVYGSVSGEISSHTSLHPTSFYGESKLAAERALLEMQDEYFRVAIVRPPMVYGPNCPGNYALLRKISLKTPVFPKVENQRSMIFIGNLVEFIKQLINTRDTGVFHPQDPQFVNTSHMVSTIAHANSKKVRTVVIGTSLLNIILGRTNIYNKVFGDLFYNKTLSLYRENSYQKYSVKQAIYLTEKGIFLNETFI